MKRNLTLLAACQALFLTNNIVFIAINGLIGLSLAPLGWMATLPVMGYVVGGALSTPLVARTQSAWGRKASFQTGLIVGILSALLCAWAVLDKNFWLLVGATVVAGYYSANAQLYRFAAAELATAEFRDKAISLVLAGGLVGAVLGPNLAIRTRNWFAVPFAGAYVALAVAVAAMFALGMGNGAVFQLVPQRFRKEIGVMTGMVGMAGGVGGFYLASSLGYSRQITGSYQTGLIIFAALAVLAMVGLISVKKRWRTTWGSSTATTARV